MQKLRQYKKTRNKNRNHQVNYDSPQGEGEFMNESTDSMLTVSDSLGNMDRSDATLSDDIEETLLDEFAGDSELSAENDYPEGNADRVGASSKSSQGRRSAAGTSARSSSSSSSSSKKSSKFEVQPTQIPVMLKDKVNQATARAQEIIYPYAKDMNLKLREIYRGAKVQGDALNTQIKKQPYYFALGAVVAGFTIAKLLASTDNSAKK